LLAACGGDSGGGTPTLNWYINNAAQAPLGEKCAKASDGRYNIAISLLPNAASGQREQLLRRLAANDTSIDIMSLDPPFMAEFANAGFLREFTAEETEEFSEGVLAGPLQQATFNDKLFSAPFYGNTQLLWYKKSLVDATGVDPGAGPVTWDQIIEGAAAADKVVAAQGRRNESLMVWVNALVKSAGGSILEEQGEPKQASDVEAAVDSKAGAEAARIMQKLAESPAAPPALSTAGEEESRAAFQSEAGAFMVNWPYVWRAFDAAIEEGVLPKDFKDDIGWARYPQVTPDQESAPPSGGIGLSISAFSENPELAVEAVRCLRSVESQTEYFLAAGDPAASSEVYDNPEIREAFPMADDIRTSMEEAAPRPISPYYGDVTAAIQRGYHPPDALSAERTPQLTADLIEGVLSNQQLL